MNFSSVEICAGAGGQALGLERAGFEHELAVEIDLDAAATLKLNRPHWEVRKGDVADAHVWDPQDFAYGSSQPRLDLFAGGVPCPPFSVAGRQLGANDERDLFAWAIEQVGIIRPRAVMLENVRGLSAPRFAGYRQHVLERLAEFGYLAEWRVLNASDFALPQLRPRFVLVAMEPENFAHFHWPKLSGETVTVGDALRDLMKSNGWEDADDWADRANKIGPTIVGGSKKHGGADLGPTRAKAAWAQLGVDGRGVANEPPKRGDKFEIGPKLTTAMVARLQGWDEDRFRWSFEGRKTSVYRQIGNAFPPPVAFAVGSAIADALRQDGSQRLPEQLVPAAEPLLVALRQHEGFVSREVLEEAVGVVFETSEFERRMASISHDFELKITTSDTGSLYRLGHFKGFLGQKDHPRNEHFQQAKTNSRAT